MGLGAFGSSFLHRSFRCSGPALVLSLVASLVACQAEEGEPGLSALHQLIVGGQLEYGYPGVGALVLDVPGYEIQSFCTGTLIAPQWVVTAAHCVSGGEDMIEGGLQPQYVSFYVGNEVSDAEVGDLHPADAFYPHPRYNPEELGQDIGLMHLQRPVQGVATFPYNTTLMDNDWIGTELLYIGFGTSNGRRDTGGGIKRSGYTSLAEIYLDSYTYNFDGTMPCHGDSGGPAFAMVNGVQKIVGIVSSGDQFCTEYGYDTRVDVNAAWVADTMAGGGAPENCEILGGSCARGTVCWPEGHGIFACEPSAGLAEGAACDADPATWQARVPCADGSICLQVSEDVHDGRCLGFCRRDADCGAGDRCEAPILEDDATLGVCIPDIQECRITARECPAGQACYPTDAEGGAGCFPSDELPVEAACDAAAEDRLVCDDGLLCIQVSADVHDGRCMALCTGDGECQRLEYCYMPIFQGLEELGVCLCVDADEDGVCASDDCNDRNDAVYPRARELCDGLDNDCDGQTDEACPVEGEGEGPVEGEGEGPVEGEGEGPVEGEGEGPVEGEGEGPVEGEGEGCTDADLDGVCQEEDCNDQLRSVYPGAPERCNDDLDNDCDGRTDEGCDCTDADGDGYCADVDCRDDLIKTHPGAGERCDDGIDNDCDGQTDEGCDVEEEGAAIEGEGEGSVEEEGAPNGEGEGEEREGEAGEGDEETGGGGGGGGARRSSGCTLSGSELWQPRAGGWLRWLLAR